MRAGLAIIEREERNTVSQIAIWQKRIGNMLSRLSRLSRLQFLVGIQPSRGPMQPSHLYGRIGPYRTFYRCYRGFFTGIAEVLGDFLQVPLRRTYDLYEIWCFLRLARAAALENGGQADWRTAFREVADRGGMIRHIQGRLLDFHGVGLSYQPLFREVWKTDGPAVGSFSREMEPDITLTAPGDGPRTPVVVLDAKYRIDNGLNASIAAIHMYRDALVERTGEGAQLETRGIVRAAFILTPQRLAPGQPDNWRDSRVPEVFFREAYGETFKFGAVTMRPGTTVEETRVLLRRLVALARA
jgi:hypothetical protein